MGSDRSVQSSYFIRRIFSTYVLRLVLPYWGGPQYFFSFFGVQAANNQPAVQMEEEDGDYHSNSSSTQLPSQHPFRNRDHRERRERHGHHGSGVDFSTVPPTPLSNRRHLMSPVRQSTDGGNSASHHYLLRSTPERLAASGSCSGGEAGSRVSSRTSVVVGGIPVLLGLSSVVVFLRLVLLLLELLGVEASQLSSI